MVIFVLLIAISIRTIWKIFINIMKKFQLWLQRKSYSQHLINLIKIKSSIQTPERFDRRHRKITTRATVLTPTDTVDLQLSKFRESSRLGDVYYPVVNKELKHKKLNLQKSFQIQQENQNMARRMKEVKSVLSLSRHSRSPSDFERRRHKEKKYEQTNDQLRESSMLRPIIEFRKYMKWQSSNVSPLHRYFLSIEIVNLSKSTRIHDGTSAMWCEIQTSKGSVRSELIQLNQLGKYKYGFPMEYDLGDRMVLKMFTCKGIQSEEIGEFQINRPANSGEQKWYRSVDGRFEVEMKIKFNKMLKKRACFVLR